MSFTVKQYNEVMKSRGLTPVPKAKPPRGDGYRSGWEREYAAMLDALQFAGEIYWYAYEGIRLRLAHNTAYTPDFALLDASGLTFIEVKGFRREAGIARLKIAAERFPWQFRLATKKNGIWVYSDVPGLVDRIKGKAGAE